MSKYSFTWYVINIKKMGWMNYHKARKIYWKEYKKFILGLQRTDPRGYTKQSFEFGGFPEFPCWVVAPKWRLKK